MTQLIGSALRDIASRQRGVGEVRGSCALRALELMELAVLDTALGVADATLQQKRNQVTL
jgi:hypothetical protein